MTAPIGFSTGFFYSQPISRLEMITQIKATGVEALELHFGDIALNPSLIDQEALELAATFSYRSIHLPNNFAYPSPEAEAMLPVLEQAIHTMQPHTLVLHPDLIEDFAWVASQFGSLLAIENMDFRRSFGKEVTDLEVAFSKLPSARWVCDVNHLFTLPEGIALSPSFHAALESRLAHYHLSGFKNPETLHACLCDTHEDEIFSGILNKNIPIIIESIARHSGSTLGEELQYIRTHL